MLLIPKQLHIRGQHVVDLSHWVSTYITIEFFVFFPINKNRTVLSIQKQRLVFNSQNAKKKSKQIRRLTHWVSLANRLSIKVSLNFSLWTHRRCQLWRVPSHFLTPQELCDQNFPSLHRRKAQSASCMPTPKCGRVSSNHNLEQRERILIYFFEALKSRRLGHTIKLRQLLIRKFLFNAQLQQIDQLAVCNYHNLSWETGEICSGFI